jgi:hypothetical protein
MKFEQSTRAPGKRYKYVDLLVRVGDANGSLCVDLSSVWEGLQGLQGWPTARVSD